MNPFGHSLESRRQAPLRSLFDDDKPARSLTAPRQPVRRVPRHWTVFNPAGVVREDRDDGLGGLVRRIREKSEDDEVFAENARTVRAALKTSDHANLAKLHADAVRDIGDDALAELAEFGRQLKQASPVTHERWFQAFHYELPKEASRLETVLQQVTLNDAASGDAEALEGVSDSLLNALRTDRVETGVLAVADTETLNELSRQLQEGVHLAAVFKDPNKPGLPNQRLVDGPGAGGFRSRTLRRTPGGNEAARLEAIRNAAYGRFDQQTFAKSPLAVFEGTNFPPKSSDENVLRGMAAVDLVLTDVRSGGKGVVANAMIRKGLRKASTVSFYWGDPGDPANAYRGGSGLSHIIAKHGVEVLPGVLDTIANGSIRQSDRNDSRVIIDWNDHRVVLQRYRDGKKETWLFTGYEKGDEADKSTDLSRLGSSIFFDNE